MDPQQVAQILFSPTGTFFVLVGGGTLVWLGRLRLEREYKRLEAENSFLREIVTLQAGSQQITAETQAKQVALSELQIKGKLP